jgi:dienelactone hydrolase
MAFEARRGQERRLRTPQPFSAPAHLRNLLAGALVLVLLARCAADTADPAMNFIGVAVDGARAPRGKLSARLVIPDGPGPFPVVILLHGCGGIGAQIGDWIGRVESWGYAVAVPDSLGPRGRTTVCDGRLQPLVTPRDRAGDVYGLAVALAGEPRIDATRIGVVGFSHGGATAVEVTRKGFQSAYPGLIRAAVDYYGNCREPQQHGTIPLLVLAGGGDTWGDALTCTRFGQALGPDQTFEIKVYPGAVHAFDNARLTRRVSGEGHPMQYDAAAAADSFARTRAFLERWLR